MELFFTLVSALALIATPLCARPNLTLESLASQVSQPAASLKNRGPLVVMGNSSLADASIVLLPEIHDDPGSLTTQLLLLALEKKKQKPFYVLDESLASFKKSGWDIFSQKSLEILAAQNERRDNAFYTPAKFEGTLKNLANEFRASPGRLEKNYDGLWTLSPFSSMTTPFFGWDANKRGLSLTARNMYMTETLKNARKNHQRIFVMAGARHIPELEFLTSKKLLCGSSDYDSMDSFFKAISRKFGEQPELDHGIGATLPIYNFLNNERYAVVFTKDFYHELNKIVTQLKRGSLEDNCLRL